MTPEWDFVRTVVRDMLMRGMLDDLLAQRLDKIAGGGASPSAPPPVPYDQGSYDAGTYG